MPKRRRQLLEVFVAEILPSDESAKHHARIQRVRRNVAIFVPGVHRPPIMEIQRTVPAAAWSRRRTAVLLRTVHPVRKLVIRHHVIELRRWLVVPGAPRLTAVARHDRALVAAENHPPRLIGINPKLVIVVSARRTLERRECLSSVARLVGRGVRDIHSVRIFGIHADFPEVPPALPNPPVIRNALPTLPAVVRTKEPALLGVRDQINPPWIARRKSDADPAEAFRWQPLPGHVFPVIATVAGAIKATARSVRRRVSAPRWPARLPQCRVNRSRISWLERQIDRSRVFIVK